MSGQMSNGEIEGVLASIRRLLREDAGRSDVGGAGPGLSSAVPMDRDSEPAADGTMVEAAASRGRNRKLVLLPDDLVLPGTVPASPGDPLVLTDPQPTSDLPREPVPGAGPDAGLYAGPGAAVAAWDAPLVLSDPVEVPPQAPVRPSLSAALRPDALAAPAPAPALGPARAQPGRRPPSLEDRIAELEAALARDEAAFEPDAGDPAPGGGRVPPPSAYPSARSGRDRSGTAAPDPVMAVAGTDPAPAAAPAAPDPATTTRLQPRLGPDEVRAWIEAESLRAFGTLPDDIGAPLADAAGPRDSAGAAAPTEPDLSQDLADLPADEGDRPGGGNRDGTQPVAFAMPDPDPAGDAAAPDPLPAAMSDAPDDPPVLADAPPGPADAPEFADAAVAPEAAMVADAAVAAVLPDPPPPVPSDDAPRDAPPPTDPDGWDTTRAAVAAALAASAPQAPPVATAVDAAIDDPLPAPSAPAARGLDAETAAAIRAIVSDAIRSELRGPLGEELTRSIRRLVRRELARHLDAAAPPAVPPTAPAILPD